MIRTLIPAFVGLFAIVGLTLYENIYIKDRWGVPGAEAAEMGKRFEQVPLNIGSWEGEDLPVDEVNRKTAGAVKYVSRRYTNTNTNKQVVVWLIVGHSRDITRHTPNVCYPSSGFRQTGSTLNHVIELPDSETAVFSTAKFEKEDAFSRNTERVFWSFNHPDFDQWEAMGSSQEARFRYGLANALYKLYFTTIVWPDEDTVEDSVAVEFAELMLPAINDALFPTEAPNTAASEAATETETVENE